jgi:hypothetical protein
MTGSNLPPGGEPLRWTVPRAALEFGLSKDTLRKRLATAGEKPDRSGTYSTPQIVRALYRGLAAEKLRETRGKADNWALKNAALRGELLSREGVLAAGEALFAALGPAIERSALGREEKRALLETLGSWPAMVKAVAERQTRQIHLLRNDGDGGGEDGTEEEES